MTGQRLRDRVRRNAGAAVVDSFFKAASALGKLHPHSKPEVHGVEVLRDVPYGDGVRKLDVWRPTDLRGPAPAVLYIHGGGFRILSKDTHWVMALAFARQGYVVFNIDYRLAPTHRYPAAVEDCAAAYRWVVENAPTYGGDASRLVLAGESAGANLVTALAVAAAWARDDAHVRDVVAARVQPAAVIAACGMLQVTDPGRFARRKPSLRTVVADRIDEVTHAYLGKHAKANVDLADPLVVIERGVPPVHALPPFFIPCGTADPLLDDSRRLGAALRALGGVGEDRYYEGELHAFHALVFRENARRCWREIYRFLDAHGVGAQ